MSEPSAKLDHNPLIVALANAVTELNTDGTEALQRWRHDRTVVDEINQLAKDADLSDSLVIEIEFEEELLERDGWKHPDRWRIRVNHPVPKRNPITVYLGAFPPVHARAALPEIVNHLRAWQTAADKTKPTVPATDRLVVIADRIEPQQTSDRSAAASDVEVKPITVTVALKRYVVSRSTLRREVAKGTLRDLRPPGRAKNSPLLLDENQIASRWPTTG